MLRCAFIYINGLTLLIPKTKNDFLKPRKQTGYNPKDVYYHLIQAKITNLSNDVHASCGWYPFSSMNSTVHKEDAFVRCLPAFQL